MADQNAKLAHSLREMNRVQVEGVVRAARLSRTHRERLVQAGFLQEVVKGWLIVTNAAAAERSSATWYASFWSFVAQYLQQRFGDAYCLGAEASLQQHVQNHQILPQVVVMIQRGSNQVVALPFDTSLLLYKDEKNFPAQRVQRDGLWLMELPLALCRVAPGFFQHQATDAMIALRLVRDPALLLHPLLEGGNSTVAGRLAGAYAFLGETRFAERIVTTMKAAGYSVRLSNPFDATLPVSPRSLPAASPAATRVRALWLALRADVQRILPAAPVLASDPTAYLAEVEERYASDAYNSLSIEGYRVTPALIEQVRQGQWNPKGQWNPQATGDGRQDALAARGYYQAFQQVKASVQQVLAGEDAAVVVARDHQLWYQEMFAPAVLAGVLGRAQLAGYRNTPVFLRGSRHVPPRAEAVLDCMETFFELLQEESNPGVRAVLGHFLFVYIHPYPDGNGRIGRFLMNVLLAGGGYPWTVIREARRSQYLAALEAASTRTDIVPFAEFVRDEMQGT